MGWHFPHLHQGRSLLSGGGCGRLGSFSNKPFASWIPPQQLYAATIS